MSDNKPRKIRNDKNNAANKAKALKEDNQARANMVNASNTLDKDKAAKSGNPFSSLINKVKVAVDQHNLDNRWNDVVKADDNYARYTATDNTNVHPDFGSIGSLTGRIAERPIK